MRLGKRRIGEASGQEEYRLERIMQAIDSRDSEAATLAMRTHLNGILSDWPRIEAGHQALFALDR